MVEVRWPVLTGATWLICALAIAGVILRPRGWPEAVWAVSGAVLLVATSLLPLHEVLSAVGRGLDVYLFLAGMILLAEIARQEGLFDWLAAHAARAARGSPQRLFALVYAVGIAVTALLSNDATAVVLTPAVYAASRAARAEPLPYLYACALVANAASFVLPISNPANLVVFASHLPRLSAWLAQFALPSLVSIAMTYTLLRWTQRRALRAPLMTQIAVPTLRRGGRAAALGIVCAGLVLIAVSAAGLQLGLPTFIAAVATLAAVCWGCRTPLWPLISGVSWSVLPLVAGLFVLVAALEHTGVVPVLGASLANAARAAPRWTALLAGTLVAVSCNLMNNLPVGLVAGFITKAWVLPQAVLASLLIGVDLGPNLSVTGSLATILWLVALRREGQVLRSRDFLCIGLVVMPPALLSALMMLVLQSMHR